MIAPDRKLEITDTSVSASGFEQPHGQRRAIDLFFRSLATRHGDAFAVVLSGAGTDGAVGAKAIKEAGGVVLVQDPREAAHDGMPRAVISMEAADLVLPVRELAARLAALAAAKGEAALERDHGEGRALQTRYSGAQAHSASHPRPLHLPPLIPRLLNQWIGPTLRVDSVLLVRPLHAPIEYQSPYPRTPTL